MDGLIKAGVTLNRKMLSEIAINDAAGFKALVELAKKA
jgi:large subunit ribosomal protein L20